jgi:hypothetical protein
VNSISGGSPQVGTITADGIYMAPADLPPGGTIQVTAKSHADRTKSSSAGVTVSSDVAISVFPVSSAVELGSTQSFHASITSSDRPDSTVRWSLSGSACPAACGTIDDNGNYTAPQILPGAAIVNFTATSAADPSRQSSASITPSPETSRCKLGDAIAPSDVSNALVTLCRNATTDPGWPPLQGCVVTNVDTAFTTGTRP